MPNITRYKANKMWKDWLNEPRNSGAKRLVNREGTNVRPLKELFTMTLKSKGFKIVK